MFYLPWIFSVDQAEQEAAAGRRRLGLPKQRQQALAIRFYKSLRCTCNKSFLQAENLVVRDYHERLLGRVHWGHLRESHERNLPNEQARQTSVVFFYVANNILQVFKFNTNRVHCRDSVHIGNRSRYSISRKSGNKLWEGEGGCKCDCAHQGYCS